MLDMAVIIFAFASLSLIAIIPIALVKGIKSYIDDKPYRETKRYVVEEKKRADKRYHDFLVYMGEIK